MGSGTSTTKPACPISSPLLPGGRPSRRVLLRADAEEVRERILAEVAFRMEPGEADDNFVRWAVTVSTFHDGAGALTSINVT